MENDQLNPSRLALHFLTCQFVVAFWFLPHENFLFLFFACCKVESGG
jgi:hypothetical protein